MAPPIRLGFVGAGHLFQEIHLPAFSQCPEVELLALCDIRETALASSLKRYGIRETTSDYREVLEMSEIDALVLTLPNDLHGHVAEQALRAGKHVLSEMPMALDEAAGEAVRKAAQASGLVYMTALPHRFDAESALLRRWIREGRLGDVYHVRAEWLRRASAPRGWFAQQHRAGGGALLQLGAHLLDLATWLVDFPRIERVSATCYRQGRPWRPLPAPAPCSTPDIEIPGGNTPDVEDFGTVTLHLGGGRTVTLDAGWSTHCHADRQSLEVFGSRAGATLWPLRRFETADGHPADVVPHLPRVNRHHAVARHFVDAIMARESPIESPITGNTEDGIRLLRLVHAVYEAARTGRELESREEQPR